MNKKTFLLGSVATLLATSAAFAGANATSSAPAPHKSGHHIPKPHKIHQQRPLLGESLSGESWQKAFNGPYMKSARCYGPGYFYIPGTESAIRFSGFVATMLGVASSQYGYGAKGALTVETKNETKYGTLGTYIGIKGNYAAKPGQRNSVDDFELSYAYFELGHMRFGSSDSVFNYWTNYYGSNIINDDLLDKQLYTSVNGISYNFVINNDVSAIVALEQGGNNKHVWPDDVSENRAGSAPIARSDDEDDATFPNLVAGIKYTQDWGILSAVAGYDTTYKKLAAKVRFDKYLGRDLQAWVMAGIKHDDKDEEAKHIGDTACVYGDWDGKWQLSGGAAYQVRPNTSFNTELLFDEKSTFGALANVRYNLTPNLIITPELSLLHHKVNSDVSDSEKKTSLGLNLELRHTF